MPGSDALHSALTGTNIHVPYRFTYADAATREAEAGAVPGDVGCLALQEDDNSLWMLTDDDPLTWMQVGYGAPPADHDHSGDAGDGGTFDAANLTSGAATDGQVLTADGAAGAAWETPPYLPLAGGTLSGEVSAADNLITRPKLKDYSEAVNAKGALGGGAVTIDIENGNVVTATIDTSETTFTFSNPSASGTACSFTLILTNGGSQTVNWPVSVAWAGGTAPSLTASGVDILTFVTVDAGTTWYGFAAGLDMS